MTVQTQIATAKQLLDVFFSSYLDGYNHVVSGSIVEFPDCHVKTFFAQLPEGSDGSFDKPLVVLLLSPSAEDLGKWVTNTDSGASPVFVTWSKHTTAVGYYVYRSLTQVGGYAKVSDLLSNLCFVDTPAAGTYWYQVKWVDNVAAETDWGSPVSKTSSAIVYPKVTRRSELVFHVFVSATKRQGGQRIVDSVCSLIRSLVYSNESAYLKAGGLRYPTITTPISLLPESDIWTNSMFLTFKIALEYS